MKGVVLAGGLGKRLSPLTKIINKHLLPIYKKPMIYYPIETLVRAGISEIMIVCGGNNAGDFLKLLGNGQEFGLKQLFYAYQEKEGGIAEALGLAEHFVNDDLVVVILGDNIFEIDIKNYVEEFKIDGKGARIFLKKVDNPKEYGVARFEGEKLIEIVEKPAYPPSDYAVVGLYMYDPQVFEIIKGLRPSHRCELEITDVNNWYLKKGELKYSIINGEWFDAGESIEAYYRVINFIAKKEDKVELFREK
ncbi:MAG: sugar phosphate nucleotidyltransferase [bacterium]